MVWGMDMRAVGDSVARWTVVLLIGALPLCVLPASWIAVAQAKMGIIAIAVLVAYLAWAIARISEGSFSIPKSALCLVGALIPIAYAVSAFMHGSASSFVGGMGEQDTLIAVVLLYALLVLPSLVFSGVFRGSIASLRALFIGASAVVVIQGVRLVFPDTLTLGTLSGSASSVVGNWHDLGIFLGLIVFIACVLYAFNIVESWWRKFVGAVGALSLVILFFVHAADVWYALAALGFVVAVSQFRIARARHEAPRAIVKRIALWSVLCVVGLLVGYGSTFVYDHLPARLQVASAEVRPSWRGTFVVGERALDRTPALLFGSGPNTFSHAWGQFKPDEVNATLFWDTDFASGVGMIPTSVVTVGVFGAIAWVLLLLLVLSRFFVLVRTWDAGSPFHGLSFAIVGASAYLMAFHILYTPGLALSALTFIFLGLVVLSQGSARTPFLMPLSLSEWKGIARLVLLFCVVLVFVYASITALRATVSDALVMRGAYLYNQSHSLSDATASVRLALSVYPQNDRGERAAVELGLLQLQELAARSDDSSEARIRLQATLSQTVQHGLAAVMLDPENYRNWLILAQLYQNLAGAGVQGAADGARDAFIKAIEANPKNPTPLVNLAQLAMTEGKPDEAIGFLDRALALKPDFAPALHLRSQIRAHAGELSSARADAETVVRLTPYDPLAWYNLGAVQYAAASYAEALETLTRAIELQNEYANALFVQALSLEKLGRREEALRALERIAALNPDDDAVADLVASFRAGKPIDSAFPR